MTRTSIVLCDDHPIVLEGLRNLIAASGEFDIVGEATTGAMALAVIRELQPNLAVIDISMPELNGLQVVRRLTQEGTATRMVIFSLHEEKGYLKQALEAGARGYVLKRSAAANLLPALSSVRTGGLYIDPGLAHHVVPNSSASNHRKSAGDAGLSDRESEVLKLTALGFSNKEIARKLDVGVKSVETFKARGLAKLEIDSRAGLIRYASASGWLSEI